MPPLDPPSGTITAYIPSGGPFVRMDSPVYPHYVVPPNYDSLPGKLIAWAPTREKAIDWMKRALNDTIITGTCHEQCSLLLLVLSPLRRRIHFVSLGPETEVLLYEKF